MKKIFMTLTAGATLTTALILGACNNAEEAKKQMEEENAKIQTRVDEKMNALQEQVNGECTGMIDSAATAAYTVWQEEQAKATKGGKAKPKPKTTPKKEEPGKVNVGQKGQNGGTPEKIDVGKKGENGGTPDKIKLGKKGGN